MGRYVAFLAHAFSVEDSHGACRVKNDVHAAVSFTLMLDAAAPLHRRRARRDECERERNERVVASKRETEEAPGGIVAAHHIERLELVAEPARRTEIAERARAFLRAGPPFPFDAGMIDAEPGVPEHAERDGDERCEQHLARGADLIADEHHERERDREVIGVALLEAERTRLQAETVLQDQGAQDGHGADRRDRNRRRRHRPGPDRADRHLAHVISLMPSPAPDRRCPHRPATHIAMRKR
jgi:hypothetical protein